MSSDHNDEDSEYEETLVYVEIPEFTGQQYFSNSKKRIRLQGLCETEDNSKPQLIVDDSAEFTGVHTINLGSNHFFECSSGSSATLSDPLVYKGHSINTTEFSLKKILFAANSQLNMNDNDEPPDGVREDDKDSDIDTSEQGANVK